MMQKQFLSVVLFICITGLCVTTSSAQSSYDTGIDRVELPNNAGYLSDLDQPRTKTGTTDKEPATKQLDDLQKELMRRMVEIYQLHIQAVNDQVNDDLVSAEEHITKALKAVQKMLEEYPELQKNERFTELYRTVYTEYQSFYGIDTVRNRQKGKIFAVRRKLYESKDDWMKGRYVLPEDITKPETEVPLVYNEQVKHHLKFYSSNHPEVMARWLKRSEKYFPMMKKIFREEGVPTELIHLSMIESGLNPRARSWASAVGMWQFIEPTGAFYGLEVNWWMDERRDPEKATRAAAEHLKDLYGVWGDWHLAIANYNISPRGLKQAIRAGGGQKNYWSAYPHLPRETQGYIPGFIATTIIDRNAEEFGFKEEYNVEPYDYEVARVAPLMPLRDLAKAAGISTEKLKNYNPELLRWATPPGSKYPLKLPPGTKKKFVTNYKQIPKDQRSQGVAMHEVRRGETLGHIAQRYGSSVQAIFETNEGLSSTIHPGQKIAVPLAPGSTTKIAVQTPSNEAEHHVSSSSRGRSSSPNEGSAQVSYTVKSGDTIGYIAEWYDVRSSQIRSWNNTSNIINVGEELTIYVPEEKVSYYRRVNSFSAAKKRNIERDQSRGQNVINDYLSRAGGDEAVQYTVKENDTLIQIARTFGVSVSDIKQINNLKSSRIYEGQRLRINQTN